MHDRQAPLDAFVGRAAELARVAEVMAAAEAGQPWLVAIEGDPGVGKTALVRRALAAASGWQVLSARASQFEADLEFGLVDQLLRAAGASFPVFPQAGQDGSAVTSFAVGARFLELVGELQGRGSLVILIEDLQWADRKSIEALTFMLRRLSVDPVVAMVTYRGTDDRLDPTAQRLLLSVEHQLPIWLGGLSQEEVASLATALAGPVDVEMARRLFQGTGGHPLYLRTVLSEGSGFDPRTPGRLALPRSLSAAIGEHLAALPPESRIILEMLAVLNQRVPLAQLGYAAQVASPSASQNRSATVSRLSPPCTWASSTVACFSRMWRPTSV